MHGGCTAEARRWWRCYHSATAVLVLCHGGHDGAAAIPLRIGPIRGATADVLNMFKLSAVPPRRSAVLRVFRGATAINDGTTAEPWCHCGLCRTSTQWHRVSGVKGVVLRRHGGTCSKIPPCHLEGPRFWQFSAVLRRWMAEPLRNHCDHGGATAVYAAQAPQWHRASGVTGVVLRRHGGTCSKIPPCHREGPRFWQFSAVLRQQLDPRVLKSGRLSL